MTFSLRRMLAVTKKEFQELVRNWMSFLLSIIAPIALFFLFAYGMPLDVKNIPMAVFDEDKTPQSRKLVDAFAQSGVFKVVRFIEKYGEMERLLRLGEVRVCVVIPQDYGRKISRGRPQSIQALVDATYPNRAAIIGGYLDSTLAAVNEGILKNYFEKRFGAGTGGFPVVLSTSPWFNPTLRSEDFIVPGVIAIILIFLPPLIAAISLSKEKETGSILNMYCSPLSKAEYLLGKALPYIAITSFNFVLFLLFTVFIFRVPLRGDIFLLSGVSLLYVVTVIGIGIFIAVLVNTQIAAILICAVATLIPSFMYSGFMLPVICMEQSARQTAMMIPTTYYIGFIRKLMIKGVGLQYLWTDILTLAGIALLLYTFSIILFKKRLG